MPAAWSWELSETGPIVGAASGCRASDTLGHSAWFAESSFTTGWMSG